MLPGALLEPCFKALCGSEALVKAMFFSWSLLSLCKQVAWQCFGVVPPSCCKQQHTFKNESIKSRELQWSPEQTGLGYDLLRKF